LICGERPILALGSVYGFLNRGVLSFYALLLAELLPKWPPLGELR
jgi:hypothetical protein